MTDTDLSISVIRRFVVLWSAFLAACFGFVLMFAFIDPELLGQVLSFPMSWSSLTGYAVGFFFLFLIALLSSVFTLLLLKNASSTKE